MSERDKSLRDVREAIDALQTWTKRLDEHLAKETAVIPWTCLDAIQEATAKLIYTAGRVNGAHFQAAEQRLTKP